MAIFGDFQQEKHCRLPSRYRFSEIFIMQRYIRYDRYPGVRGMTKMVWSRFSKYLNQFLSDWYNFWTVFRKHMWQWNDTSFFWYFDWKWIFSPLELFVTVLTAKNCTSNTNIRKSSCHSIVVYVFKLQSKNCINRTKPVRVILKTVTIPWKPPL